jgi:hypothetical protein
MADDKKHDDAKQPDAIELVAVERGFVLGRMVEPGRKFMFRTKTEDGKPRKLPKWAQPADKPLPAKTLQQNGDLKPKDAQEAVAKKAGVLGGAKVA